MNAVTSRVPVFACALAVACAGGARLQTEAVSAMSAPPAVPALPPDTVPSDRYAPERLDPTHSFPRDLIVIAFREGTSVRDKQAAIDLVQGTVVGGWRLPPGTREGLYLIRIREEGTVAPLLRALRRLRTLPQVDLVGPDMILRPGKSTPPTSAGLVRPLPTWRG